MAFKKMGPFVKWAGGKNQLIDKLHNRVPNSYGTYSDLWTVIINIVKYIP